MTGGAVEVPMHIGLIWDIDGVVVDSPHEEAWRQTAMKDPWNVKDLTADFYFAHVASRPRYEGGDNILELKGVYERLGARTGEQKHQLLHEYSEEKNRLVRDLIDAGKFRIYPDAVALLLRSRQKGILQAAASASKNARRMLMRVSRSRIIKEVGNDYGVLKEESLYSIFDVDACGLDLPGKREILSFAGHKLHTLSGTRITTMVVFEDAPSGIEAAKSLGYCAIGILRIGTRSALEQAGADVVTQDLSIMTIEDLLQMVK